ncbi:MAG TPA: RecQ family zinc-binding domain-containing protein [Blastocatellia bacterium]|nr:RecQ family zinc-binding domain-containing protein [Blastocatellia bacterium]
MINNVSDLNGAMRTSSTGPFPANTSVYRPNLRYEVERVSNEGEKRLSLVRLLRETDGGGVVYAATVREVKAVTDYLKRVGFDVAPYPHLHGQLGQLGELGRLGELGELGELGQLGTDKKLRDRNRFLSGDLKAIITVSECGAAPLGMGHGMNTDAEIDKPDIRFVIHYNMPMSLEDYHRESARAGRDGLPARCVLLFQIADRRAQSFVMNGRSPKPEEVVAVYAALETLGADLAPAPLELIQTSASDAPRIKVRAILSLLKNMGFIKERRGARYTLLKRDLGEQEMRRLAGEYTSKGESDREKLERMTLYAQSPECRWKLMLEHFGARMGRTERMGLKECGHCDNCFLTIAEQARAPEGPSKPDFIDLLFSHSQGDQGRQKEESRIRPGDVVKLPAHGEVKVKAIEGDKIVVSLPDGETRKFKQEWVIR